MSLLPTVGAIDQDTGFYNGVATQSLRFNGAAEHTTLWRKMASDPSASRRKAVFSWWMKGEFDTGSPYFWTKGSGGGVADIFSLLLNGERLQVIEYLGDSNTMSVISTRLLRDYNAWYHILWAFDSTQASPTNRVQLFINGVKETEFDTAPGTSNPSQNHDHAFGYYQTGNAGSTVERIGGYQGTYTDDSGSGGGTGDANSRFNGYMAEWNYVDGLSFFSDTSGTANSSFNINSFGETKNGVWIPKKYTGSHGNWGYRLEFKNTSVGSGTSSTVGADTSGNNHHWTSTGIAAEDCNLPDSPENSFATMNHLVNGYANNMTMREGNLALIPTNVGSSYTSAIGNFLMSSGKWYFEAACADWNNYCMIGIARDTVDISDTGTAYGQAGVIAYGTQGEIYNETASSSGSYTDFLDQEVIGVAVDLDSSPRTVKFYNNNSLQATINLSSNFVSGTLSDNLGVVAFVSIGPSLTVKMNFGADSSFSGTKTSGSNEAQDGNGIGDFFYAPPSGYFACCNENLPEPVIGPNSSTQANDHFDVLLYTGTGNDDEDISGLNFKPDLVWKKSRTENVRNTWTDSSRGVGKDAFSDTASFTESNDTAGIKAFNADGFRLGTSTNHNVLNKTYVAWNWKANGGTTTTNDASATGVGSIDSVIQADTTAGFSIVTFTGNNVTNSTIGHGVQVNGVAKAPAMIITKNRDDGTVSSVDQHWRVYHQNLTDTYIEFLSRPLYEVAPSGHSNGYIHDVTSTTYKTTHANVDSNAVNGSGDDMVAWCWAEVEGYSKFGFYETNAVADGPFVYTGFKPAFVMVKNISGSSNGSYWSWTVHDDTRVAFNPRHTPLYANLYRPEGYRGDDSTSSGGADMKIDFYSNGFKDRSGATEHNGVAGGKVIYMAFASQPSKYANAE